MIVAIHQPQFLPWLGYFHKMAVSDVFCILDTVQYKKNEWQNRNRIKTAQGWQWLTVPVSYKFPEKILDVQINNATNWRKKHLQAITTNYRKAPYYDAYFDILSNVYEQEWKGLADLNLQLIHDLREALGISRSPVVLSSRIDGLSTDPTQRLVDICRHVGGDVYLAGADGPNYMDMDCFQRSGVRVGVQQFDHPRYPQCFGDFESHLSVIDLLFNLGPGSLDVILASSPEPIRMLEL